MTGVRRALTGTAAVARPRAVCRVLRRRPLRGPKPSSSCRARCSGTPAAPTIEASHSVPAARTPAAGHPGPG